jgi:hypothetical protein
MRRVGSIWWMGAAGMKTTKQVEPLDSPSIADVWVYVKSLAPVLLRNQSNLIWLKVISLSHRCEDTMWRMVPDLERMTMLEVRAPPP